MIWVIVFQALAAFYLVTGALVIDASKNLASRIVFKVIPMMIGLPLAFAVFQQIAGK